MKLIKVNFLTILVVVLAACNNGEPLPGDKLATLKKSKKQIISDSAIAIVIHGGAGAIRKENMPDSLEQAYMSKLDSIISYGYKLLENDEEGIEVVTKVISEMENSPLFNAGKGAVFTYDETNELDASIMHGRENEAGAVAGVKNIKNPILLAKAVMQESDHVMMSGEGAEQFAELFNIERVDPSYFYVKSRMDALRRIQKESKERDENEKHGTVGCVVLDKNGDIVAGTSTGGMTNKRWGRIGDSPVIGAGTYADNNTCGVSSTGWGEYFIRGVIAYDIAAVVDYKELDLSEATNFVIQEKLTASGGTGGVIALDKFGNVSMEFNTDGMYRASIDGRAEKKVLIYK